jgi:hypothetical protein
VSKKRWSPRSCDKKRKVIPKENRFSQKKD